MQVEPNLSVLKDRHVSATSQQHISNTLATHQQHISNTLATHYQHIGNTLATHQQHIGNIYEANGQQRFSVSNTLATHQQHIINTLATPMRPAFNKVFARFARNRTRCSARLNSSSSSSSRLKSMVSLVLPSFLRRISYKNGKCQKRTHSIEKAFQEEPKSSRASFAESPIKMAKCFLHF